MISRSIKVEIGRAQIGIYDGRALAKLNIQGAGHIAVADSFSGQEIERP